MSTAEAMTTLPEVPIPSDLTITVTMRRPYRDGTPTVVEFIPETSRRAIFEEYREMAWGIAAAVRASQDEEAGGLDEVDPDDVRDGE